MCGSEKREDWESHDERQSNCLFRVGCSGRSGGPEEDIGIYTRKRVSLYTPLATRGPRRLSIWRRAAFFFCLCILFPLWKHALSNFPPSTVIPTLFTCTGKMGSLRKKTTHSAPMCHRSEWTVTYEPCVIPSFWGKKANWARSVQGGQIMFTLSLASVCRGLIARFFETHICFGERETYQKETYITFLNNDWLKENMYPVTLSMCGAEENIARSGRAIDVC